MSDLDATQSNRERQVFLEALELQEEVARAAYLQGACAQDPDLLHRVESLLAEHYSQDTLLAKPAVPALSVPDSYSRTHEGPGTHIGRYKLLQKLGEGGFGVVYMAEQREPVKRRVALKIIKLGMDTRQVIARFEAERQALALMDHPNIAKVLDGGSTDTGRPYFVMELVKGIPFTTYCNENSLGTRDRLALFIAVCHAIQHAHQKGIIHRDIKPSNVLVTLHDGVPVPKVIDFGIAKATQQELTDKTIFTQYQHMLGTPAYMSPEQAELSGLDIDTRSDIYSLGVLLYELLVGRTPLGGPLRQASGPHEIRRRIREEDTPRPSTSVQTLSQEEKQHLHKTRGMDADKIRDELRGDLDWIVLKALEKDRRRRYDTVIGLVRDIQCYLNHEPVLAAPPSRSYLLGKYMRRHATALAVAGGILFLVLAGAGVSAWQAVRATRAQREAERAGQEERSLRVLAQSRELEAEAQRKRADQAATAARTAEKAAQLAAYSAQMLLAQASWNDANLAQLQNLLSSTANNPERGFEWDYWQRQCRLDRATLNGHKEAILRLAISPDGQTLASADSLGILKIWDLKSFKERHSIPAHPVEIRGLAFSPSGETLASGDSNSLVRLWNTSTGREIDSYSPIIGPIRCLRFSNNGKQLAAGSKNGTVHIRNLETGQSITHAPIEAEKQPSLSTFSPDFKWAARGYIDGSIAVWDIVTGLPQALLTLSHSDDKGWRWIHSLDFSPDGRLVSTTAANGDFNVLDITTGAVQIHKPKISNRPELFASFSPDGKYLALSGDQVIRLLDSRTGEELQQIRGHSAQIQFLLFSKDGGTLVSGDQLGQIKVWDVQPAQVLNRFRGHTKTIVSVQFSPDGRTVLASDWRDRTLQWDSASGELLKEFRLSGPSMLLNDNRRLLACHGEHVGNNSLMMVDIHSGKDLPGIPAINVMSFATTAENNRVLTLSADGSVRLWDTATGGQLSCHFETAKFFHALALSPKGDLAAVANDEHVVLMRIENEPGHKISRLGTIETVSHSLAYSPDGLRVLVGTDHGHVKVCRADTGHEILRLEGHTRFVSSVSYSPDGKRIASSSDDGTIRLWHGDTGHELLVLKAHRRGVADVHFSPDGRSLVSASPSGDGTVTVWESATPLEVTRWSREYKEFIENLRDRPAISDRIFHP